MTDKKKTCFIIMPITTPAEFVDKYRDGKEHFEHVLECLMVPCVEAAGFEAIRPIAKGSDIIHAEIIENLENSDLVLCDMSCLNPNVFFEFGIRTSLNKPVCVVKDGLTSKVPFDAGIINHQQYSEALDPWKLPAEISMLSKHITDSEKRSKGVNTLWKYFGMKSTATPYSGEPGANDRLDFLSMQVESLKKSFDGRDSARRSDGLLRGFETANTAVNATLHRRIMEFLPSTINMVGLEQRSENEFVVLHLESDDSIDFRRIASTAEEEFGISLWFRNVS